MNNDLISRSALLEEIEEEIEWERAQSTPMTAVSAFKIAMRRIKKAPAADAVEVIRCGDCEHYVKSPFGHAKLGWCKIDGKHRSREFYCAHADRRGANEET